MWVESMIERQALLLRSIEEVKHRIELNRVVLNDLYNKLVDTGYPADEVDTTDIPDEIA